MGEWQAVLRGEGGSNLAGTGSTSGIPGAVGVVNILGETIGGALRINVSDIAINATFQIFDCVPQSLSSNTDENSEPTLARSATAPGATADTAIGGPAIAIDPTSSGAGGLLTTADTSGAFLPETVTLAGSDLVFHNTYGGGVSAAYRSCIVAAENFYQSHFSNAVTLNMNFDLQPLSLQFSGQNNFFTTNVTYSALKTALAARALTSDEISAVNSLPTTDPSGGASWSLSLGYAKMLNLFPVQPVILTVLFSTAICHFNTTKTRSASWSTRFPKVRWDGSAIWA